MTPAEELRLLRAAARDAVKRLDRLRGWVGRPEIKQTSMHKHVCYELEAAVLILRAALGPPDGEGSRVVEGL